MKCDILIRGDEVIDPSQSLRVVGDVAATRDRITVVAEN